MSVRVEMKYSISKIIINVMDYSQVSDDATHSSARKVLSKLGAFSQPLATGSAVPVAR